MAINCVNPDNSPSVNGDLCVRTTEKARLDSFMFRIGTEPFTDQADTAEWAARLNNDLADDATNKYIRRIFGKGSMPKPSFDEVELDNDIKVVSDKEFVVTYTIYDLGPKNLAFLNYIETHSATVYQGWFGGEKSLHGDKAGVSCTLNMWKEISDNRKEYEFLVLEVKFTGVTPPTVALPEALKIK